MGHNSPFTNQYLGYLYIYLLDGLVLVSCMEVVNLGVVGVAVEVVVAMVSVFLAVVAMVMMVVYRCARRGLLWEWLTITWIVGPCGTVIFRKQYTDFLAIISRVSDQNGISLN